MDFGSFFGGIGNFLGGLFGGDDQKKKQQQQQQSTAPAQSPQPAIHIQTPVGIQAPKPFVFNQNQNQNQPQQQPNQQPNQPPQLGGVVLRTPFTQNSSQQNPLAHLPQQPQAPQAPQGSDPINGLINFGKQAVSSVGATARLGGDLIANGAAHIIGNKSMENQFNQSTANDYNNSLIKPIPSTLNLIPDVLGGTSGWNKLHTDASNSLIGPVVGTADAINTGIQSQIALNNRAAALSQTEQALKSINQQEQSGQITHDQSVSARNDAMAKLSGVNQAAQAPTAAFQALDPQTVASNAAMTALMADGGIKGGVKSITRVKNSLVPIEDTAAATEPAITSPNRLATPKEDSIMPHLDAEESSVSPKPGTATKEDPAVTSPNQPKVIQLTPIDRLDSSMGQPRVAPAPRTPVVAPDEINGVTPHESGVKSVDPTATTTPVDQAALEAAQLAKKIQAAPEAAKTPAPVDAATLEAPEIAAEKAAAETAVSPKTEAQAETRDNVTNPTDKQLGTITRKSILDGSINTPEGVDRAISDVTTAAHAAAERAGDSLENIVKKGQQAWENSHSVGHDLTESEVQNGYEGRKGIQKVSADGDPSFTPEQQKVYKAYGQELSTLRDRSGHSLTGGHQGAWYGPRQFLQDGESAAYNPELINEVKRVGGKTNSNGDSLDYSHVPYEHYIRRYANASDAASKRLIDAVEKNPDTGEATGLKVPKSAKDSLKQSLADITAKRDEAVKLQSEGDISGSKALGKEIQSDTNKAFKEFANSVPSGDGRGKALAAIRDQRGAYMQSTVQTLSLSNVVNRLADQGQLAETKATQPLARLGERITAPFLKNRVPGGNDVQALNTTKEARQAINEMASGTKRGNIANNFKVNMSLAGAGRNPLLKAIAKVDAAPRAVSTAVLQAGDLDNLIARKAMQLGVSREEASGLKTVDDYKKYLAEYVNSNKYKEDLDTAGRDYKPRVGLAGAEGTHADGGGSISKALSAVDNAPKLIADQKFGINPKNRLVQEGNDLWKNNVTGYAGVGSRVLGRIAGGATLKDFRTAVKLASRGNPGDLAHAQQLAGQSIADAVATYGSAAGALTALNAGPLKGVIGYTGAPATPGSSDSSYNKAHNIPANNWYVNLPNGKRLYIGGLSRAFAGPGVAADLVGSIATSKDIPSAVGNVASQVYNQAGGSSLPDKVYNLEQLTSPYASASTKKYAGQQLQQTMTPSTGILGNVANWTDPTKRAPNNFVDDLKSRLPVLRSQTPVALDSQGNPITNSKQISGGSSLFSVGDDINSRVNAKSNPLDAETSRLQKLFGNTFPTNANTNAKSADTIGYGNLLMNDPLYKSADDKGKNAFMKQVLSGTAMKGIQSSLGNDDKQALLDAKLLGSAKTKVQVDSNNDFAAKYETARYNNAKAAGTLDPTTDDNLQDKSGLKYKMVQAQVNKAYGVDTETKIGYHDTTVSEWKAMLNPQSDSYNPDLATKLYKYDQALTAKGVSANSSDSSKPKYDLKTLQATNAKKAGKLTAAQKSFNFANLPSTLTGVASGTASGGSKYAKDSPLFTPIASLKTPTTATIPKGRSISITKGQHV